jgi:hypothetical protein
MADGDVEADADAVDLGDAVAAAAVDRVSAQTTP